MAFKEDTFYHIYDRGVNKQVIFPLNKNYLFFISKIKSLVVPNCSILSYCLMPNHFHFLIYVNEDNVDISPSGQMQTLQRKIGTLQSSYTRAVNKQENRVGPLFQAKFKAIELTPDHALTCFHYIHQNSVKANLSATLEGWEFSSYREYVTVDSFRLCEKVMAYNYLGISEDVNKFQVESLEVIINDETIGNLTISDLTT